MSIHDGLIAVCAVLCTSLMIFLVLAGTDDHRE